MKGFIIITTLLLTLGTVNSVHPMKQLTKDIYIHEISKIEDNNEKCKICLDLVDNFIQNVLNLALNVLVGETCQEGCVVLAEEVFNDSTIADAVCTVLCLYIGMEGFVKILDKIDIDPIYYCEELKGCPYTDYGNAKIDSVTVQPQKAAQGSTFDITIIYTVVNTTGTADIVIDIRTVDKLPLGAQFVLYQQTPGQYDVAIKVNTRPSQDCQPPDCESWLPGMYLIDIDLCEAQCNGRHPHHKIYDKTTANFTIVG